MPARHLNQISSFRFKKKRKSSKVHRSSLVFLLHFMLRNHSHKHTHHYIYNTSLMAPQRSIGRSQIPTTHLYLGLTTSTFSITSWYVSSLSPSSCSRCLPFLSLSPLLISFSHCLRFLYISPLFISLFQLSPLSLYFLIAHLLVPIVSPFFIFPHCSSPCSSCLAFLYLSPLFISLFPLSPLSYSFPIVHFLVPVVSPFFLFPSVSISKE